MNVTEIISNRVICLGINSTSFGFISVAGNIQIICYNIALRTIWFSSETNSIKTLIITDDTM